MVVARAEKGYERHAWVLLIVVAIFDLIGAFIFLISPGTGLFGTAEEEAVTGGKWNELVLSNPEVVNIVVYAQRILGAFLLSLAVFIIAVARKSFRRGEKWAWYASLVLPVSLGVRAATDISFSFYSNLLVWMSLIMISLLGLLLPYRKFFPRRAHENVAGHDTP